MPTPAISPASVGAPSYTVSGSAGVAADLLLFVPGVGSGPTFQVRFPAARAGVRVVLSRGGASLDLIPAVDDGAPAPTFAGRRVISSVGADGASTVVGCEVRALAGGGVSEPWRVAVSGLGGDVCVFTQPDNDPAAPSVARIMCDPVAVLVVPGGPVRSRDLVSLIALPGNVPTTVVRGPGAADPGVLYRWALTGAVLPPGFPTCGPATTVSFTAPKVRAPAVVTVALDVWFDGSCPATPGVLNGAAAPQALTIVPVAEAPSVTPATTNRRTQTTSGLNIAKNPADGPEVTHFKITNIQAGRLFQQDGATPVAGGAFITVAQGAAGLRFTPDPLSTVDGRFDVQASLSADDSGLGIGTATAQITVRVFTGG